jgi:prepilin-type N-terminal cleavage/methylation domain-containing protein
MRRRCPGFTFVEVLVALALFGIVAAVLLPNLSGGIRLFSQTKKESKLVYEAQSILEQIKSDVFLGKTVESRSVGNAIVEVSESDGVMTVAVTIKEEGGKQVVKLQTMVPSP